MKLILASASPQRKTLLRGLGLSFEVIPSRIEESSVGETDPARRAELLSALKARDVASRHPGHVIIGCDTLVTSASGALLEKPRDDQEARRMLMLQSGHTSVVHSGVTVISDRGEEWSGLSSSHVTFAKLTDDEIAWWIESKLWEDRSGAFQVDGPGQLMIKHIDGDWTGIVGLPVFLLGDLLAKAGSLVTKSAPRISTRDDIHQ